MTVGFRLSPYTREVEIIVVGRSFDETNTYHVIFDGSKLKKQRTITVIPDDGKAIQTKSERLTKHEEYWVSTFRFEVDGDLAGRADICISWTDSDIEIEVHKGEEDD